MYITTLSSSFCDLLFVDHIVFGKDEEVGYDGETSAAQLLRVDARLVRGGVALPVAYGSGVSVREMEAVAAAREAASETEAARAGMREE